MNIRGMVSINTQINVNGMNAEKLKVFHIFYKNITTFMSYSSDTGGVRSKNFDNAINDEFDSVIFYNDTSFSFTSSDDEALFFLKYYDCCDFEKIVIKENFSELD